MKALKKLAAVAMAAVMAVAMFTACSGGGGNGGGNVTLKTVSWEESQTKKWLDNGNGFTFAYRYEGDPEFTSAKTAWKNGRSYTELYTNGVLQLTVLGNEVNTYAVFTPDCAYYKEFKEFANGKAVYTTGTKVFDLVKAAKGDITTYRLDGVDYYAESFTDNGITMVYCYDKAMKLVGCVGVRNNEKVYMIIEGEIKFGVDETKFELPKDAIYVGAPV